MGARREMSMQKPAVELHEMAMNESIATTCCYVWNGVSLVGSASLPHGGRLTPKYDTKYYYSMTGVSGQVSSIWLDKSVGIHPGTQKAADETYAVWRDPKDNEWYVATSSGTYCVTTGDGFQIDNSPGALFARNYRMKNIRSTRDATVTRTLVHFIHSRSTSPHNMYTSGNNWLPDHQAYQYSS